MTGFIAHSGGGGGGEPLAMHLAGVARRAEAFLAAAMGDGRLGRAAGLLHDAGKLRLAFQRYITGKGPQAEHSICGAVKAVADYPGLIGWLLAYVVAGHHAGLPDGGAASRSALKARLADAAAAMADMASWPAELELPELTGVAFDRPPAPADAAYAAGFLVRMLFSALVDADFLATEHYYRPGWEVERRAVAEIPLKALLERLDAHLDSVAVASRADPQVRAQRAAVLAQCRARAGDPPGVFSLSVPTGGGKTLSSLAFALRHAIAHGQRRVIYVIPYTSIIEQTADVFRQAFGDLAGAVLEHHSAAAPAEGEHVMGRDRLRLATENWDAPVVVTTSVQFFESLYAADTSRCRKLHNIAASVVVLDEVQALPLGHLDPCVRALRELVERWRTSVVLCSATLPDLAQGPTFRAGFQTEVREIVGDVGALYGALARVRSERAGRLEDEALAERLAAEPQVLCVVDSRAHAAGLHALVSARCPEGAVHLSAAMCPAHRRAVLAEVRARLENRLPCRLVATTVIEAGVDVSFPVVYRAAAGLDSLAQAAGRCNRHGERDWGRFVVFETPHRSWLKELDLRRGLAADIAGDPLALTAVQDYFRRLFTVQKGMMDRAGVLARMDELPDWPFRRMAADFRLIDEASVPVIVSWRDMTEPLLAALAGEKPPLAAFRGLQQVSVSIYPGQRKALEAAGALEPVGPEGRFLRLVRGEFYDEAVGLSMQGEG